MQNTTKHYTKYYKTMQSTMKHYVKYYETLCKCYKTLHNVLWNTMQSTMKHYAKYYKTIYTVLWNTAKYYETCKVLQNTIQSLMKHLQSTKKHYAKYYEALLTSKISKERCIYYIGKWAFMTNKWIDHIEFMVIFLYHPYIFIQIQHGCLANMVFALNPSKSVIKSSCVCRW